ncbi:hypothetical protein ADUPG1_006429 [Aduncisulcus paluster]|uniref:Uncharacterized protein n=1 Tax=Aduncisulcus paluster TaxID=2918883 RepID=A0ABQ5KLN3_9EUKA|nr:hypothetical protein ADUPG1_006429 [Aduncisulcus paluster]
MGDPKNEIPKDYDEIFIGNEDLLPIQTNIDSQKRIIIALAFLIVGFLLSISFIKLSCKRSSRCVITLILTSISLGIGISLILPDFGIYI